jgi:hypothetical protein
MPGHGIQGQGYPVKGPGQDHQIQGRYQQNAHPQQSTHWPNPSIPNSDYQNQGQGLRQFQQNAQPRHTAHWPNPPIPNGDYQNQGQYIQGQTQGQTKAHQGVVTGSPVRYVGQVAVMQTYTPQAPTAVAVPPLAVSTIRTARMSVKGAGAAVEDCSICMCPPDNPKTLPQCKHTFCTTCIDNWFANKPSCPICGKVYGKLTGTQPRSGTMNVEYHHSSIPGFEGHGNITIKYNFPDGRQSVSCHSLSIFISLYPSFYNYKTKLLSNKNLYTSTCVNLKYILS